MDDLALFESPKLLLQVADESISELEAGCAAFLATNAYDPVRTIDPNSGDELLKYRFRNRIPGRLRVLASRIVNDLRHALDQAMCEAAVALGRPHAKRLYFPFGRDAENLELRMAADCKGVDGRLLDFVRALKPHEDGLLYALSVIAGPNKHQRTLRVALDAKGLILDGSLPLSMAGPLQIVAGADAKWNDLRNELLVMRIQPGGSVAAHDGIVPALQIVIGEGKEPLGGPAASVLRQILHRVEGVVLGLEAETERLLSTC